MNIVKEKGKIKGPKKWANREAHVIHLERRKNENFIDGMKRQKNRIKNKLARKARRMQRIINGK